MLRLSLACLPLVLLAACSDDPPAADTGTDATITDTQDAAAEVVQQDAIDDPATIGRDASMDARADAD